MKIALILVAATLVSASSISPYSKLNYSKQRSISAVLTEVEAKLQNNSPLNSILNVLKQFKDAVNVEQVNHDEIYLLQDNECYSEFDFRSKEVEDASNVVRDSTAQLNVCKTSKIRTTNQQEVNQQQLFTYQEHLTLILATAESEQGYFKKRGRDYEDSLHAIDEALDILWLIHNYLQYYYVFCLGRTFLNLRIYINIKIKRYKPQQRQRIDSQFIISGRVRLIIYQLYCQWQKELC